MKANLIILAGGMATRIKPLTNKIPKLLIDLNGKPFAYYLFKNLEKFEFEKVILCVNFFKDQIYDYFNKNSFNLNICFIEDDENFTGTAGAVFNALQKFELRDSLVMYGDTFLNINYNNANKTILNNKSSTLFINKNKNAFDKSNVYQLSNKKFIYDANLSKENDYIFIDYGLSNIYLKDLENFYNNCNYNDLKFFFDYQSKIYNLYFQITSDLFYEIGSFKGIERFLNEKSY